MLTKHIIKKRKKKKTLAKSAKDKGAGDLGGTSGKETRGGGARERGLGRAERVGGSFQFNYSKEAKKIVLNHKLRMIWRRDLVQAFLLCSRAGIFYIMLRASFGDAIHT